MDRRLVLQRLAALAAGAHGASRAQAERPISLVVGYSAGGSADFVARVVAEALARRLGRQVIVENVAGASGMLAAQKVLNGPADGTLVYFGGTDTVAVPLVNPKVRLDWEKDLQPLGRLSTFPMVFAVPAGSPHRSLAALLGSLRRDAATAFNYATPGIGTMQHFYGALINSRAGVSMLHVPYRGGAQIANDLVGGQVDSAVLVLSTALNFIKEGRVRALSVSDSTRVALLPDVPRIGEEEGFGGVALPLWQGLFAKAGTPAPLVARFEQALLEVLGQPEVGTKLRESGFSPAPLPGAALRSFVVPQAALYRDIVKAARIAVE